MFMFPGYWNPNNKKFNNIGKRTDCWLSDGNNVELNKDNMIDKTTEKKPRNIMEIWDKSTENMRSDELRIFR